MSQFDDSQLGAKRKVYSVRKGKIVAISFLYGMIAMLMSVTCVFFSWKVQQEKPDLIHIAFLIVSGMCGLFGFVMMLWRLTDLRKKVQLYQYGMVLFGHKETIVLPYSQIERIYWEIKGKRKWFGKNQTTHTLIIDSRDQEQTQLSSKLYAQSQAMMEIIEKEVSICHLESYCTKLEQGEEVHFDDISLHLEYLRIPDGYVSWSDFGGITLQNGMVYLINKLDEPFYGVKLSKFPNFALFTNLTQHINEQNEQNWNGVVV